MSHKWDKVFKSGLNNFCGRQPLKNLLSPLLNTLSQMSGVFVKVLRFRKGFPETLI